MSPLLSQTSPEVGIRQTADCWSASWASHPRRVLRRPRLSATEVSLSPLMVVAVREEQSLGRRACRNLRCRFAPQSLASLRQREGICLMGYSIINERRGENVPSYNKVKKTTISEPNLKILKNYFLWSSKSLLSASGPHDPLFPAVQPPQWCSSLD